jgi:cation:H+ antiporter
MIFLYGIAFIILGVILAKSADWVVKATAFIAHKAHVRSFLLGFLLLGFATTIPEMFVAYQAIQDGVPQLSVGNLLGGSILLLSFVMGGSAIILKRIKLDHGLSVFDIGVSSIVILAPAVVIWDGNLTRLEGWILVGIYVAHILFINKEQHVAANMEHHAKQVSHAWHAFGLLVGGLIGMAIASRYIVTIAELVAAMFSIPTFVIGLFLVTFGTNLPEITLAVGAIIRKQKDIAFGDILGSSVINTPLLGIICIVRPFTIIDHERMQVTLILLALVSIFFFWAAATKKDITRREGIVLFVVYIAFVIFELIRL